MSRPPLPLGAHGDLWTRETSPGRWKAWAYHRGPDGVTRLRSRNGTTRTKARDRLLEALTQQRTQTQAGEVSADSTVQQVSVLWLVELDRAQTLENLAPNTVQLYRGTLTRHILPALGGLRLREVTVTRCDRCLTAASDTVGPSTAAIARSVLSGLLGFAVRHGGLVSNPVRDVSSRRKPKRAPRAMTEAEREDWLAKVEADPRSVRADVPDLTRMFLATGARRAEILAISFDDVDFGAGTVAVDWQITRIKGEGLVRRSTKTAYGKRTLRLPTWAVVMLRRRKLKLGGGPVFPSTRGGWRDPNRVSDAIRKARSRVEGFDWVTSHVWRKTVLTALDDAGVKARHVSDQAGHSKVSMTTDNYLARGVVDPAVVAAIEQINPDRKRA